MLKFDNFFKSQYYSEKKFNSVIVQVRLIKFSIKNLNIYN